MAHSLLLAVSGEIQITLTNFYAMKTNFYVTADHANV
jgi:hypothetical protein